MSSSIIFFGTPEFSVPVLDALCNDKSFSVRLVVTQPDRPAGRGQQLSPSPVKQKAIENNIPVLQPIKLKRELPEFLSAASNYGPFDIGVVVAFGQILPIEVLSLPAHGCINIHGSLLPRWRGAAPMQHAIMSGDTKTGVQLMQMDVGLDTGAVYCSSECPITNETTLGDLHDTLSQLGASLLVANLTQIIHGKLNAIPQTETGITYASKIDSASAHIDWSLPANTVLRKIHALSPFPGAYAMYEQLRLKIFKVSLSEKYVGNTQAGTILEASNGTIIVGCGSGALTIHELQLQGRKKLPAIEFLKGSALSTGTILR